MEHVAGLVVLAALTVLTACISTPDMVPDRADGTYVPATATSQVDQPVVQTKVQPPGSRVRSPVLDAAFAANSNAAIIMFLLQNPGDPFADMARTHLNARRTPDSPQALQAAAGANAALVAAFDAARLANTDAAWAAFLAQYGDTPLAAEVPAFR